MMQNFLSSYSVIKKKLTWETPKKKVNMRCGKEKAPALTLNVNST